MPDKKTIIGTVAALVLAFAFWYTYPFLTKPKCVKVLGPNTVKVETLFGDYVDVGCDASEIRVWLKRHNFEIADSDKKIYVR